MSILKKIYLYFILSFLLITKPNFAIANEKMDAVIDQIQVISNDLKTLEKAFYKSSDVINKSNKIPNSLNEDVLTKHLLRLNEIEEQFRDLTNNLKKLILK